MLKFQTKILKKHNIPFLRAAKKISRFTNYSQKFFSSSEIELDSQIKKENMKLKDIPDIRTFMKLENANIDIKSDEESYMSMSNDLSTEDISNIPSQKTFFIETYGCQMNENDSEIVSTILTKHNLKRVFKMEEANVILTNTCSVRDSAEEKVWNNIHHIKGMKRRDPDKIFGILGCMAERMKEKILEKSNNIVDLIAGPDAYRDLPGMIDVISNKEEKGSKFAMNVQLSLEETYADIMPVRESGDSVKAFLSIMRGCNNMCSFCVVPFTRGRERSRDYNSILEEVKVLRDKGVKEITLLGQNVNSYQDISYKGEDITSHKNSPGFRELYKLRDQPGLRFAELIDKVSDVAPEVRFRFTSPHPKDFPGHLIDIIKSKHNLCKQIHMPAQSGNSKVLKDMRRYYTREAYLELVKSIRDKIPLIAISSDFISGFCGETEEEFKDTLTLLEEVKYDMAFLFAYSMRDKTHAYHKLKDDVEQEVKFERLRRMIDVFRKHQLERNKEEIGSYHIVLVEGLDRKSKSKLVGRTDTNKLCIFPNEKVLDDIKDFKFNNGSLENDDNGSKRMINISKSDYVMVRIDNCSNNTLFGSPVALIKQSKDFFRISDDNPYIKMKV